MRELRDPNILKILSTTAVFAAPFARRAICIAHGIPCAKYQGWKRLLLISTSFKIANMSSGAQLVAVSEYTASHLDAIFGISVDKVILNPVNDLYLDCEGNISEERNLITYMGRLTSQKGLLQVMPIIRDFLDKEPTLEMCIIGEGPEKDSLMKLVDGDSRFRFLGKLDNNAALNVLSRTKIFVSANKVEGLGIAYLEALSQGCIVVMPAGGGGLEIALEQIGSQVHLLPLSLDHDQCLKVFKKALTSTPAPFRMHSFSAASVAAEYLSVDAKFTQQGLCSQHKVSQQG